METVYQEKDHILSVLAQNHTGVLQRISGLFSRRCYNIKSIVAAQTADAGLSEVLIVVTGDGRIVKQVKRQLEKLVDVERVTVLDREKSVVREHVLLKVAPHQRKQRIPGGGGQHLPRGNPLGYRPLHAGGAHRRAPDVGLLCGAVSALWDSESPAHRHHGHPGGRRRINQSQKRKKGNAAMLTLDKVYHAAYVLKDVIRTTDMIAAPRPLTRAASCI